MNVPSNVMSRVKREYPMILIQWNKDEQKFEIMEKYFEGCLPRTRRIMDYWNEDDTFLPIEAERTMFLLHMADTKKNPLAPRFEKMRQERNEAIAKKQRDDLEFMIDHVKDNEAYFTTKNRFFMDPASMPAWKSTLMPSQERMLRQQGKL